jgi:hypothetical protein
MSKFKIHPSKRGKRLISQRFKNCQVKSCQLKDFNVRSTICDLSQYVPGVIAISWLLSKDLVRTTVILHWPNLTFESLIVV